MCRLCVLIAFTSTRTLCQPLLSGCQNDCHPLGILGSFRRASCSFLMCHPMVRVLGLLIFFFHHPQFWGPCQAHHVPSRRISSPEQRLAIAVWWQALSFCGTARWYRGVFAIQYFRLSPCPLP